MEDLFPPIKKELSEADHKIIREILRKTSDERKFLIIKELVIKRNLEFNPTLGELILVDEDPGIRSMAFWALSSMGEKKYTQELLDSLAEEENYEAALSMIDSFWIFAERHSIRRESLHVEMPSIETSIHHEKENLIYQKPVSSGKIPIQTDFESHEFTRETESIPEQEVEEVSDIKSQEHANQEAIEARRRVKQLLIEINPNIPIGLKRIAELTGVTEKSLERFLVNLTASNKLSGEYYPVEQVFIKQITTTSSILDVKPRKEPVCDNCGTKSIKYPCETCGGGDQCSTCKLLIGKGEEVLGCPHCNTRSHTTHIKEWIKIKGSCPNCRNKLKIEQLV